MPKQGGLGGTPAEEVGISTLEATHQIERMARNPFEVGAGNGGFKKVSKGGRVANRLRIRRSTGLDQGQLHALVGGGAASRAEASGPTLEQGSPQLLERHRQAGQHRG